MNQPNAYTRLEAKIAEIKALDHLAMLSNWDESTFMQPGSASDRAEITAQAATLRRNLITSSEFGELLAASSEEELTPMQNANLRVARVEYEQSLAIPEDLLQESKRAFSASQQLWELNRPDNNWRDTKAALARTIEIRLQLAECYANAFHLKPYDALISTYEPGLSQELIDPVFEDIRDFLIANVGRVESDQPQPIPLTGNFSEKSQLGLAQEIMATLNFDFERGRLDQSAHPFSSGTVNDARITTRIGESDFTESLFAVIHETGHSRYTQNQPHDWLMQFAGEATGMAVHESQSLFLEMQVARSDPFLEYIFPIILDRLQPAKSDPAWTQKNFQNTVRFVKRDLIRVYADEMSYPFHVLLRYEIEKQLCKRELKVDDIPDAWNHYMQSYLDSDTRGNFKDGCMQDIHWYAGLFGYFPCYLIGAVYAAQLKRACLLKIGNQDDNLRNGDLSSISAWLADNIHTKGSLYQGPELMRSVTGTDLSADDYLNHLTTRYLKN